MYIAMCWAHAGKMVLPGGGDAVETGAAAGANGGTECQLDQLCSVI